MTRLVYLNYTGYDSENKKQIKFLNKLEKFGYRVVKKPVKKIKAKGNLIKEKANLDVELSIDVLDEIENFNNIILVSGDSDFAYLAKVLKGKNKKVIVLSARGHVSKELINISDFFISLESLKEIISR